MDRASSQRVRSENACNAAHEDPRPTSSLQYLKQRILDPCELE